MNATVFVKIPMGSGFVKRPIQINDNETIELLKRKIKEETKEAREAGYLNFILKDENGYRIKDDTLIYKVNGYDYDDGTLTLTLRFQSGGNRIYKRKVKKQRNVIRKRKVNQKDVNQSVPSVLSVVR